MTVNSNKAERLESFQRDGFLSIREFIGGDSLRALIANVDRFIQQVLPELPREHVFYEDKNDPSSLKQIQQLGTHDRWFEELFTQGAFREVAEAVLQGPVIPKNMQYFDKPPGTGKATPPHQDGYYFMLNPCEAVTMWIALDDVDEENGCVRYVRGSHRLGMRQHARTQTLGFSQGIVDFPTDADQRNEVALPARPGDLLVHDALTIHRADPNRSMTRSRRALGFIYYSERAREDKQAQAAYQQNLAEQLRAEGKI